MILHRLVRLPINPVLNKIQVVQLGSRLEFGNSPYSHFVGGSFRGQLQLESTIEFYGSDNHESRE